MAAIPTRQPTQAPTERRSVLRLPGAIFAVTTLFVAVGAINSQNNLLFWVFGLMVGVIIVSGVISGSAMMRVRLSPLPVGVARAHEPVTFRYRVQNLARFTPVLALEGFAHGRDDAELRCAGRIASLPPGSTELLEVHGVPRRRGRWTIDGAELASNFPFGFARKTLRFTGQRTLLVLPARVPIREDVIRKVFRGAQGGRVSPRPASAGDELFSVREYTPGDSPRRVAWRPSARLGELRVRQLSEPETRSLWLRVETQGLELHEVELALALAGSIAESAGERGESTGLWIPAWGVRLPPSSGSGHSGAVLRALAMAHPGSGGGADLGTVDPRDVVSIGAGPTARFDVRQPAAWLARGAELPVFQRSSTPAEQRRRTLRQAAGRLVDRIVGREVAP